MARHPSTTAGIFARRFFARIALLATTFACGPAFAADENAEPAPLASHWLLLDIARSGASLVAVGDHGHILVSADQGNTWTQSPAPTRAMLTGVTFPDPLHGWTVGHDGVILATTDGGRSWRRQDDRKNPDAIYLDVYFQDAAHGFVVGAYGKFLATIDGGKTWTARQPVEGEVHFNRISAGPEGYLYLAGEGGTLLISTDGGAHWTKSEVPYEGSLFGALPLDQGAVLVYGLRGHILRSDDHGANWTPLNSETKVLIMGGLRLKNGTVILGGQGGNFFISRDAGHTFAPWQPAGFGTSVADLIEAEDGNIVTVGEAGAVRIKLP